MLEQKILVIDDSQDTRLILLKVLRSMHYEVVEAVNANEAIQEVRQQPDLALIILDLGLPDRDGLEVLRIATRERPKTPVCVLSGRRDRDSVAQAVQYGCADYIIKPLFLDHFTSRIGALTGKATDPVQYHPIRASLRVSLAHETICPDMAVVQVTEDGMLVRASAWVEPGRILELAAPGLVRAVAMPQTFYCRVKACRRAGYGRYFVSTQFVGLSEDIVSKIRARSVRSLDLHE